MLDNGDSTLIVTPYNKKVLIDGGGSRDRESFDVGERTVLPYLLDRGINFLDYIIISHFDSDHCGGLITIIQRLKVKNIIISKQAYMSKEFEDVIIATQKKSVNVIVMSSGNKITIDKDTYIQFLYPDSKLKFDDLNNNSILCKLVYKEFSSLFTGDIEELAEKYIVGDYGVHSEEYNSPLQATILKVPHHGSKTSSTQEFLNAVKPKIALIGVGKNNTFRSPECGSTGPTRRNTVVKYLEQTCVVKLELG